MLNDVAGTRARTWPGPGQDQAAGKCRFAARETSSYRGHSQVIVAYVAAHPEDRPQRASAVNEPHQARQEAESFGSDAERYDRARPRYPAAMVQAIAAAS